VTQGSKGCAGWATGSQVSNGSLVSNLGQTKTPGPAISKSRPKPLLLLDCAQRCRRWRTRGVVSRVGGAGSDR
jgi:hypothetical protein